MLFASLGSDWLPGPSRPNCDAGHFVQKVRWWDFRVRQHKDQGKNEEEVPIVRRIDVGKKLYAPLSRRSRPWRAHKENSPP